MTILNNIRVYGKTPKIRVKISLLKYEAYLIYMTADYKSYTMIFNINTGEIKNILLGVISNFDGNAYNFGSNREGIEIEKLERGSVYK